MWTLKSCDSLYMDLELLGQCEVGPVPVPPKRRQEEGREARTAVTEEQEHS